MSEITFSSLGHHGRLGNQMFQYALLVGIAQKRNLGIVIPEGQMLGFCLTAEEAPRETVQKNRPIFREKGASFHFDEEVFQCLENTDFSGYFQSYRYFEHAQESLRREFQFVPEVEAYAKEWKEKINLLSSGRPTIAVHVRRGDYLNFPNRFAQFNDSYFERAKKAIGIADPVIVFYSDDLPWLKQHYSGEGIFYLDEPDEFVCLCVASQCDHFICSASTYSWWAAWLNPSNEKKVVIPSPWFGPDFPYPESENQRSPESWLRVDPGE